MKSPCLTDLAWSLASFEPDFVWITRDKDSWSLHAGVGVDKTFERPELEAGKPEIGYFSYELSAVLEPLSRTRHELPKLSDHFTCKKVVSINHQTRNLPFELESFPRKEAVEPKPDFLKSHGAYSEASFINKVNLAKHYIEQGDVYQLVLANRFSLPPVVSSYHLFCSMLELNPSPYHFYLKQDYADLTGASPETMLQARGEQIMMRPIAGTYPIQASTELVKDAKEHAEHVMLVDHVRNDFGKVAKSGSVRVEALLAEEHYATVKHLVSRVVAELAPGFEIVDALHACFPIATLVGTPSIRAMQLISELEEYPRGNFGGLVYFWDGKNFDSTVFIRSATCYPSYTEVFAGAGIVYDSVPEKEYAECLSKILPFARYYA